MEINNRENLTGIILAGGKSSRMGSDKGLIKLNGKLFIEHILAALIPCVDEVIIIANSNKYNTFGYKVYKDIIKDCGPLGGIYAGLMKSKTEKNVIVSCDIPFINSDLLNYIIEHSGKSEIAVPVLDGNTEPLCGVYAKHISNKVLDLINKRELKLHDIITQFKTKQIVLSEKNKFYFAKMLMNINTPEELKQNEN